MRALIILLLLTHTAFAEVLIKNENGDFLLRNSKFKLSELISDFSRIEGYNLSVSNAFKDESFLSQGKRLIKKENIEKYISDLIHLSGNASVRMPGSRFFQVIAGRDIRYTTLPVYKNTREIPRNSHYAQVGHVLKHIDAPELTRNIRPFLSKYGRVIDVKSSNSLHIADTGKNLLRLSSIIYQMDTPEFLKSSKEIEEINKKHRKAKEKSKSLIEILSDNNIIFILIFLLIGAIVGFGLRGYMMKKLEGGW